MIPISKPSITEHEIAYVTEAVSSGWVSSLGPYIDQFENDFAAYCDCEYGVSTSNGTVALHLALVALGIGENSDVIIPDLTFVATANAVKYTGATVNIVDIEPDTLCICPKSIVSAIKPNTKAIIPVHLYGHPANMNEINRIAREYNLLVIEDAAEAHGACVGDKKVGSLGNVGVFSFYGNKIITTGEGGMITTNSKELYDRMRFLRDHAMSKDVKYWHNEIGFNYRMTNLQASLGMAQLNRIDSFISKRKLIYKWYESRFNNVNGIKLNRLNPDFVNVYWLICMEFESKGREWRDELINTLKVNGIDCRPYFFPLSDMPMFNSVKHVYSHQFSAIGINLPCYFDLNEEDVDHISNIIKSVL
jgi:perosamine synthetase